MFSRRKFFARTTPIAAGVLAAPAQQASSSEPKQEVVSLCGEWEFRTGDTWRTVQVPHTWQIAAPDHRGVAWYRRKFEARPEWKNGTVRIEFEAVFHTARVSLNGKPVGEHIGKGYTAFAFEITSALLPVNELVVEVDNHFADGMLPRMNSSDWAHDGGIYRPVKLLITPRAYIENAAIDATPDSLTITPIIRNSSDPISVTILEEDTGRVVLEIPKADPKRITAKIQNPRLWHFDSPHLYRARLRLGSHTWESTFGIRKFEVRGEAFYLNGERVFLMGVERMAGSNPEFGMAEPAEWIEHDHADLKNLNCVFTRVHWQQDRRVLDYCDRHGILIQTEVPTWGGATFKGMKDRCDADILQNGIEQLREMIYRDRNHPCIFAWGLCNEIGGQNAPAYDFAKNMLAEAKRLDPGRLCSYASHSLFETPGKDVAAIMDFVECNEYVGSWQANANLVEVIDRIHAEIPGKPVVISEYGYCACTADRPEGDQKRGEILLTQDAVFRDRDWIGGLIFFCYNDYRTHVGDRGLGAMQQRVHGVVDVYGNRKPSYELLRNESSPVESLVVSGSPKKLSVRVKTRSRVPAYTLKGYSLRAVFYGQGGIPVERKLSYLPELKPGEETNVAIAFADAHPLWIQLDVMRPTGFSAYSQQWKL